MRQLQQKLSSPEQEPDKPRIITVWFNPWRYEKEEHLIVPFLKAIEKALSHQNSDGLKLAVKRIRDAAAAIAYGSKFEFQILGLKYGFDTSKAVHREEELDRNAKQARLSARLTSLYYDVVSELKKAVIDKDFRIVVFVDDLDRCLPEKAVELLESIKLFLDLPGYVFVIGVDRDVIEKGITYHYRFYHQAKQDANEGIKQQCERIITPDEYLDKMIQVPLELPPIRPKIKKEYIRSLLGDYDEDSVRFIERGIDSNPRCLKRFVNLLAYMSRFADRKEKDLRAEPNLTEERKKVLDQGFTPTLYTKWALIVFGHRFLYNRIKGNPHLLLELQEQIRTSSDSAEEELPKLVKSIPDSLRFILSTEPYFPESEWLIKDFVYLASSTETLGKGTDRPDDAVSFGALRPGDMVLVRKGKFLYGEEAIEKDIPYDYWIDAFPVTNRQYQEFLQDEGYAEKTKVPPYGWDKEVKQCPAGKEDHPVVGVSFEDAKKFCEWRSLREDQEIRLPTEMEWEKAARGTDGRLYPWGDEFAPEFCNVEESRIRNTTPVTNYHNGITPFGCYDMAGNVWEWTFNGNDEERRGVVIRGGSWSVSGENPLCTVSTWFNSMDRAFDIGFRCVRKIN